MKINTERLEIVALNSSQLNMWCTNITELENMLGFKYEGEPIEGILLNIIKGQINLCENDNLNYLWHSFWLIISKVDRVVVGSCAFKNIPNKSGEVEIGYGLGNLHEHKGYMTECIKGITSWALKQDGVQSVIAETEPGNLPSEKVLQRCGFVHYKTENNNKWWKI